MTSHRHPRSGTNFDLKPLGMHCNLLKTAAPTALRVSVTNYLNFNIIYALVSGYQREGFLSHSIPFDSCSHSFPFPSAPFFHFPRESIPRESFRGKSMLFPFPISSQKDFCGIQWEMHKILRKSKNVANGALELTSANLWPSLSPTTTQHNTPNPYLNPL